MNLHGRFIVAIFPLFVLTITSVGCHSIDKPATPSAIAALSPTRLFGNVEQSLKGPEPNREIALASFAQAEKTFDAAASAKDGNRTANFREAVKPYRTAAKNAPHTTIEEDALMMVAESHFFADEYNKATEAYDTLIQKYPRTRHLDQIDQRRFAIAQYWLALTKKDGFSLLPNFTDKQRPATDTFGFAGKTLDKIRFDNPTGKLADDATMASAIANFEKRKFGQADILFDDIRENFPSSQHQFQAHLLGLKCKQEMYRGPDYSGTVLDEGERIIKRIYQRFPEQAAQHDEQLQAMYLDLRLKQAARDYSIAQYYDNRKEFGAAKIYYQNVQEKFNDTNLALESEDRMSSIQQFPDRPPEALQWLADLFPKEEGRAKPLFQRSATGVSK